MASDSVSPSVLFVASECAPLNKTGGLADVAAALPIELAQLGVDMRVLLPGYPSVLAALPDAAVVADVPSQGAYPRASLTAARGPQGQSLLIVKCDELYAREGGPYQDASGRDWPDNALRFGFLSHVAATLCAARSPIGWRCDVLRSNDWQRGLRPHIFIGEGYVPRQA